MKITPRIKSSLIQTSIANIFFLLVFLGLFFVNVLPGIREVSEKKEVFGELFEKYETTKTAGITFAEYNSTMKKGGDLDAYTKNLLKDMPSNFYKDNFENTAGNQYSEFLQQLANSIQEKKGSNEYKEKDMLISTVLPSYSGEINLGEETSSISDFEFINAIENILYNFNLSFIGEIGVGSLENIESEVEDSTAEGLTENIFQIPLQLSVSGRKRDIVDFIHYFENVGSIDVSPLGLEVYTDDFITSEFGEPGVTNIYRSQFADIQTLQMQDYPDSSSLPSEESLIEILSTEQGKQRMNIDVILNFYLAGVPAHQMEQVIIDYFSLFEELQGNISKSSKKYAGQIYNYSSSEALISINKLTSLDLIMEEMSEETNTLKKQYGKKENIEDTFKKAAELSKQLGAIQAQYEEILTILQ